jgi:hypothetical protein
MDFDLNNENMRAKIKKSIECSVYGVKPIFSTSNNFKFFIGFEKYLLGIGYR